MQLVLDLPVETRFGAEDFLVSPSNEHAYALLEQWPNGSESLLRLEGPPGSGKSHLAAIWAERNDAVVVPAAAIGPERLPSLGSVPLVVEDLDRGSVDEASLFHLVNISRERRHPMLFTSRVGVERSGIRTADLLSRLRLAPSGALCQPDDALLRAVLVKLFLDRQIVVDTAVIDYTAVRIERSLARAAEVVAELDRETLSRSRRVTRAIAAEVLARHTAFTEDGA